MILTLSLLRNITVNTRKKHKGNQQNKSQKIKSKNPIFLSQSNGLYNSTKNLARQHRSNRDQADRKNKRTLKHLKQQYYESVALLNEGMGAYMENKYFMQFIKSYTQYNQQSQQNPVTFQHLCKIAAQIQFHATKENSIYLKAFSQRIFMKMYGMVMSQHPMLLEVEIKLLVNSIFQLMLDPIRHEIKLQQYARKVLLLITARSGTVDNSAAHAAQSIWKLCLLANLHDDALAFSDLFEQANKELISGEKNQISNDAISELQNNITSRIRKMLSEEALTDLAIEYRIGPYVVDMAFPSYKLVIEIDGVISHHQNKGQRFRDEFKDILLARQGWYVVRIPSYEYHANRRSNNFEAYIHNKFNAYAELLKPLQNSTAGIIPHYYKMKKQNNPTTGNLDNDRTKQYSPRATTLSPHVSCEATSKIVVIERTKKSLSRSIEDNPKRRMLLSFDRFPEISFLTGTKKSHMQRFVLSTKKFSQKEDRSLSFCNIFFKKESISKEIKGPKPNSINTKEIEGQNRPSYKSILIGNGYFKKTSSRQAKNKGSFKSKISKGTKA